MWSRRAKFSAGLFGGHTTPFDGRGLAPRDAPWRRARSDFPVTFLLLFAPIFSDEKKDAIKSNN